MDVSPGPPFAVAPRRSARRRRPNVRVAVGAHSGHRRAVDARRDARDGENARKERSPFEGPERLRGAPSSFSVVLGGWPFPPRAPPLLAAVPVGGSAIQRRERHDGETEGRRRRMSFFARGSARVARESARDEDRAPPGAKATARAEPRRQVVARERGEARARDDEARGRFRRRPRREAPQERVRRGVEDSRAPSAAPPPRFRSRRDDKRRAAAAAREPSTAATPRTAPFASLARNAHASRYASRRGWRAEAARVWSRGGARRAATGGAESPRAVSGRPPSRPIPSTRRRAFVPSPPPRGASPPPTPRRRRGCTRRGAASSRGRGRTRRGSRSRGERASSRRDGGRLRSRRRSTSSRGVAPSRASTPSASSGARTRAFRARHPPTARPRFARRRARRVPRSTRGRLRRRRRGRRRDAPPPRDRTTRARA